MVSNKEIKLRLECKKVGLDPDELIKNGLDPDEKLKKYENIDWLLQENDDQRQK